MADTDPDQTLSRGLSARMSKMERVAEVHERNAADLARALTASTQEAAKLAARIEHLETDRQERLIAEAGAKVEDKQMRIDMHDIKTYIKGMQEGNIIGKVNDMSSGFNRLFWLVIGAIVTGGVAFIFVALRSSTGA